MKEAMLPVPVTKIKQEPDEETRPSPGQSFLEDNYIDSHGATNTSCEAPSPDKVNGDRSESLSNASDADAVSDGTSEGGVRSEFKYECPICQARFKSARAFRGHGIVHRFGAAPEIRARIPSMEVGHGALAFSPKRLGFESSSFKCDGCQTVFNSRDTYAMHMLMRAKDENCGGCIDKTLQDNAGEGTDAQLEAYAIRQGLWNLQMMQKGRLEGKVFDYQQVIPDLIPSPGGTRDLIVCRICGEIFQSKDSLAMHMMFHTQSEAENSRRGWAVIYTSNMSELNESPEDLIANHELVPIDDPAAESLDGVPHVANDAEVPYSEGVSDDPCYSDEINEGLDLSISSKANGSKDKSLLGLTDDISMSKYANWYSDMKNKSMEIDPLNSSKRGEEITDMKPLSNDLHDRLFCFQYNPPNSSPEIARSQSADANCSRKPDINDNGGRDVNIIKCLTEDAHRYTREERDNSNNHVRSKSADVAINNHVRSKSADVVFHRNDKPMSSSAIGKIRKLRKSRVPTRKNSFRQPYRIPSQIQDYRKYVADVNKPQFSNAVPEGQAPPKHEGERSIINLLAARGKDLSFCKYCEIIYMDRTLYQLHMGLHNVNNPWQCNACGRICANRLEFSSHVLHY